MTLAEEMREISKAGKRMQLAKELDNTLEKIRNAAVKGERGVGIHPPELLSRETMESLYRKGFVVKTILAGQFTSSWQSVEW